MKYILTCAYARNLDMDISTDVFNTIEEVRECLLEIDFEDEDIEDILSGVTHFTDDDCWWKVTEVSL